VTARACGPPEDARCVGGGGISGGREGEEAGCLYSLKEGGLLGAVASNRGCRRESSRTPKGDLQQKEEGGEKI